MVCGCAQSTADPAIWTTGNPYFDGAFSAAPLLANAVSFSTNTTAASYVASAKKFDPSTIVLPTAAPVANNTAPIIGGVVAAVVVIAAVAGIIWCRRRRTVVAAPTELQTAEWSVFVSYCWKNSKEAMMMGQVDNTPSVGACDPREVARYLTSNGYVSWLDADRLGSGEPLFANLVDAIRPSKLAIICVSDDYVVSANCAREVKFVIKNNIPYIVVVVGSQQKSQWSNSEIGFLVGDSVYIETQGPKDTSPEQRKLFLDKILAGVRAKLQQ